ncbi:MAG: hypothetical protein IPL00_00135 [Gammaproteobacteria bacterium]|nr:hypothetical protein [Gammaproteobacteria bacterium]
MIRIHSWLLIVVAVLIAAAPVAAKVDPGLVGAWFVMTSNSQGALLVTLDIKADGSYVIRGEGVGAPPPRTGRFDAANGTFTMTGTPGDSGTYMMPYPSMLQLPAAAKARSGGAVKTRMRRDPQMGSSASRAGCDTDPVAGQSVPRGLPDYLVSIARQVTSWQNDARLVALEIRISGDQPSTRFYFWSPQGRQALLVMPDAAIGYQVSPVDEWNADTTPLPPRFIDLEQAAKVARQHGMKAMNAADLRVFAPDGRPPVLAWQLRDSSGPWYVDGLSGALLVGDVSGDRAYLEAEWQSAAAGMRSFMNSLNPQTKQMQGHGGARQCGFSYPTAGTDYQCTSQGGNWSCTEYYGGSCTCSVYTAC